MSDTKFLKRMFQAYYQEKQAEIPVVSLIEAREFGFIPWEKQIMIRHVGFMNPVNLKNYLINNAPKHTYSSGSIYEHPENQQMDGKEYKGCDFIVDIDVDHFHTPCKEDHDVWYCKECGKSGKGMVEKCPSCSKSKLKKLSWICDECLEIAKNEIIKLIYDFLIPDFSIEQEDMKIAFSGHRGYHLKVENNKLKALTGDERREIVDYLTGNNISFEILGLREISNTFYGLNKENIGWSHKIMTKLENFLKLPTLDLERILQNKYLFDLGPHQVQSLLNYKDDFLEVISDHNRNIWAVEGFGIVSWKKLLGGIVKGIGIELDEPVSIDIHRLIRYPGSLHGKTGFKVQEIPINYLDNFTPLDEDNTQFDPIVFKSKKKITQKVRLTEQDIPSIKIKGEIFGPYKKDETIEVPHHIAVFLLCKGVAKTI